MIFQKGRKSYASFKYFWPCLNSNERMTVIQKLTALMRMCVLFFIYKRNPQKSLFNRFLIPKEERHVLCLVVEHLYCIQARIKSISCCFNSIYLTYNYSNMYFQATFRLRRSAKLTNFDSSSLLQNTSSCEIGFELFCCFCT